MAPMKASREMAVARSGGNTRKRLASDTESDSDSDSDFSMTKTGGGRSRGKKPRNSSSTKHSAHGSNKVANSAGLTLTGVKLPKEMACPEGNVPFTKAHWKVIVQTDEFWQYFNKMVPESVLRTRLAISIKTDLKEEQMRSKEAKEAKTRVQVRQPSAVKGGPVNLPYDARDDGSDLTQQHADEVGDKIANPATKAGLVETVVDQIREEVVQAKAKGSDESTAGGLGGILDSKTYNERIEEQKRLFAEFEAAKATKELEVGAEGARAEGENTGSEAKVTAADSEPTNLSNGVEDPAMSLVKHEDAEKVDQIGEDSKSGGQEKTETATSPPKISDTNPTATAAPVSERRGWEPKDW